MGSHHPIRKTVTPEIPDKLYFRIGDVARICEVPAYVLRFWETEFPQLKPNKGGTGQRLYRKRDVEMALRIKGLLYDQGYTIPGARQVFKQEVKPGDTQSTEARPKEAPFALSVTPQSAPRQKAEPAAARGQTRPDAQLKALQTEMRSLLTMLSEPAAAAGTHKAAAKEGKVRTMRTRLTVEPARPAQQSEKLPLEGELF